MLGEKVYLDRGVIDAIRGKQRHPTESPSEVLRRLLRLPPSHERRGRKPRPRPQDEDGDP